MLVRLEEMDSDLKTKQNKNKKIKIVPHLVVARKLLNFSQ
jgi:hypothetical protein